MRGAPESVDAEAMIRLLSIWGSGYIILSALGDFGIAKTGELTPSVTVNNKYDRQLPAVTILQRINLHSLFNYTYPAICPTAHFNINVSPYATAG